MSTTVTIKKRRSLLPLIASTVGLLVSQNFAAVRPIEFVPITIPENKYNAYLDHEHSPAWFGKGTDTLNMKDLPLGEQEFGGIKWKLAPSKDKPAAIILKGAGYDEVSVTEVKGIPINQKLSGLVFLFAYNRGNDSINEFPFKIVINYKNGTKTERLVEYGDNIRKWQIPANDDLIKNLEHRGYVNGRLDYKQNTLIGHSTLRRAWPLQDLIDYRANTKNPKPNKGIFIGTYFLDHNEVEVESIDLVQIENGKYGSPALFAVTGIKDQLFEMGTSTWGFRDFSFVHKDCNAQYDANKRRLILPYGDNVHHGSFAYTAQLYKGDFRFTVFVDSINNVLNTHLALVALPRLKRHHQDVINEGTKNIMLWYAHKREGPKEEPIKQNFMFSENTHGFTNSIKTITAPAAKPNWMRIERKNGEFIGSVSDDGKAWTEVGRKKIALPDELFLGIYSTLAHSEDIKRAAFTNITVEGTATGSIPQVSVKPVVNNNSVVVQSGSDLRMFDLRGNRIPESIKKPSQQITVTNKKTLFKK